MIPLELDELIDRHKSTLFLTHLAKATQKQNQRELTNKKVNIALKKLDKINTETIQEHLDKLDNKLEKAMTKEKEISKQHNIEDHYHTIIKEKIQHLTTRLEKLTPERQKELEQKIEHKTTPKEQVVTQLRKDITRLSRFYHVIKKSRKYNKKDLEKVGNKLIQLKNKLATYE